MSVLFARRCLAVGMYVSSHELACSPTTRCLQGLGIYHLRLGLRQKRQVLVLTANSEMCFFSVYDEQLPMRLLFSDGSPASASGKHRCRDHVQLDLSRLHRHQW